MKKRIALALALVFLSCFLVGCTKEPTQAQAAIQEKTFEVVETYGSIGSVVVDRHTGVMYWRSRGGSCVLTMLVNADGTPKVWADEQEE